MSDTDFEEHSPSEKDSESEWSDTDDSTTSESEEIDNDLTAPNRFDDPEEILGSYEHQDPGPPSEPSPFRHQKPKF